MKPAGTLIVVALALATGFFFGRWYERPGVTSNAPPPSMMMAAPSAPSAPMMPSEPSPSDRPSLTGKVLELIQVPKYTYLRLSTATGEEWAAVGTTTSVKQGDTVTIAEASQMANFSSPTLNRTFATIYFGNLGGGSSGEPALPSPTGASPFPSMLAKPPATGQAEASPHGAAGAEDPGPGAKVERAKGESGKTVSEVHAQRQALVGKTVKVHGRVTKVVSVQGLTYLHLRDGSGEAGRDDFDLMVTTKASPAVNAVVTVEGPVAVDRDVGIGKVYPVMLDTAQVVEN